MMSKHLKPMSNLFHNKAQKEYHNTCIQFSAKLYKEISLYIEEHNVGEKDSLVCLLHAFLANERDVAVNEKNKYDLKGQSQLICDKMNSLPQDISGLGKLMFSLLDEGTYSDFMIKVESEHFLVHRDILCARSQYFNAMLQVNNRWSETNDNCIELGGVTAKAFSIYICHLYGAFVDCPYLDMIALHDLTIAADMFVSDDLKAAIELFIQRDKCHFFHKPCTECIDGMPQALRISHQFQFLKLNRKCLKWNTKHFGRLWPTKGFCWLPSTIQEQCYYSITKSLNTQTVISITLETDGMIGHLTFIKWAMPAIEMANKLMSVCIEFIAVHLYQLTDTDQISKLFQGMGCRRNIVEEITEKVHTTLSNQNACLQHVAVQKLLVLAEKGQWNSSVVECLKSLDQRISSYLTTNYYAVIHSDQWKLLPPAYKEQLQANTLCQGDAQRKPCRKPVLSSSAKFGGSGQRKTKKQSKDKLRCTSQVISPKVNCEKPIHEDGLPEETDILYNKASSPPSDEHASATDNFAKYFLPPIIAIEELLPPPFEVSATVFRPFVPTL